jgi:hypothetical protein
MGGFQLGFTAGLARQSTQAIHDQQYDPGVGRCDQLS